MKMRILSTAVAVAIAISSCKKNVSDDQPFYTTDANSIKAKTWFENETSKPAALHRTTAALNFSGDQPQWDKTLHFVADHLFIIPIDAKGQKTTTSKFAKVLVLQEDATGGISEGYYAFVLTTATLPQMRPAPLLNNTQGSFNGAVIKYSIDGSFLSASHFADGERTTAEDRIATRKQAEETNRDNPGQQNIVPVNCNGNPTVCIDWYWQTFEDGVLISEEYVFTSCECEGSGGGGNGDNTNCYADLDAFKGAPTSESLGATITYESSDTRTITYPWVFYKSSTGPLTYWGFSSYEQGTHKKDASGVWKWESLVHQNITKFGIVVGGSVTCTLGSATPQVGVYNAGMELYYTMNAAIICKGFPLGAEYNFHSKSPVWHVEYRPMTGD